MSHELRTPLNAIIGYSALLEAEIAGRLTEGQRTQLARIDVAARHLLEIIEEILSFSRIEAGHEKVHARRMDLALLAREMAALIEPSAHRKGLAFHCVAPDRLEIETDPGKVRQILLNLLSNAVRFTEEGEVRMAVAEDDHGAIVRVSDTGVGIAAESLEQIFEPFTQLQQEAGTRAGGTGLGLSVTRRLVVLLGGSTSVESEPGKGSVFEVRLPHRTPEGPAEAPDD